jgi:hypothetical protein
VRGERLPIPRIVTVAALAVLAASCTHSVAGQPIAAYGFRPKYEDFDTSAGVAVLHYYGVGGWGIRWKDTYLLTAPYFSNHDGLHSSFGRAVPNTQAIREGFDDTPYRVTNVILVGHGHIDHASDIPSYPLKEMGGGRPPTLVADESTINLLGKETRARVCAVPLGPESGDAALPRDLPCPTGDVRIRPLPWQHAPHARFGDFYLTVGDPQGFQAAPRDDPPEVGNDWLVGRTWAYVIDLLQDGKPAFRILYVDAAANPLASPVDPIGGRPVDVHIACVPGFDLVAGYPEEMIQGYGVRYVLGGHWENFFQDREERLEPVPIALDDAKMDDFVARVEAAIGAPKPGAQPINQGDCEVGETCGPHTDRWAIPIPGETFRFRTRAADAPSR